MVSLVQRSPARSVEKHSVIELHDIGERYGRDSGISNVCANMKVLPIFSRIKADGSKQIADQLLLVLQREVRTVKNKAFLVIAILLVLLFSGCGLILTAKGLDIRGTWLGEMTPDDPGEALDEFGLYITTQSDGDLTGFFVFYIDPISLVSPEASFEPLLKGFGFDVTGTVDIEGNIEMIVHELVFDDPDDPEYAKIILEGTVEVNEMSGTFEVLLVDEEGEIVDEEDVITGTWTAARE